MIAYTKGRRAANDTDFETWDEGRPAPTLNAFDNATETRATVLISAQPTPVQTEGMWSTVNALTKGLGSGGPDLAHGEAGWLLPGTGVRRLTPVECERLMGCPDDWTRYRLDEKRGETVEQADSSRYRQCGNGLVVDVMEWIVGRMQGLVDDVDGQATGRSEDQSVVQVGARGDANDGVTAGENRAVVRGVDLAATGRENEAVAALELGDLGGDPVRVHVDNSTRCAAGVNTNTQRVCECCGNDDSAYAVCFDCLPPENCAHGAAL